MPYTPQQALASIKQKKYAAVYFLQGEEPYYIDLLVHTLANQVLSNTEKDLNCTIYYGHEQTLADILTQARRFPMAAAKQVVIVKEAQELSSLKKTEGQRLLERYVQNPQTNTILVFAYKYKTIDARTKLSKALAKHALVVQAKKIYETQLIPWMIGYVKEQQRTITEKAAGMLQDVIGNDLTRLAHTLDTMHLNLAADQPIDDEVVQTYAGISSNYNAFELQKALARKDTHKAYHIVSHLAANPTAHPILPMLALWVSFFSKLLIVHHTPAAAHHHLAQLLQVSPHFVPDYLAAAQQYPLPQVIANIHHLHQADLQLKGVDYPTTPAGEILKELVVKLLHTCTTDNPLIP